MRSVSLWAGLLAMLSISSFSWSAPDVTLRWVGCGISKKAYLTELAKVYEKQTGVHIDVQGGGATRGIREVAAITADVGGSCRNRLFGNHEETGVVMVPVAWDALAVIVHKDNPVSDISLDNLRRVYLGEITNWKELGGPDRPLRLLVRQGKISGVGYTIRKLVFDNEDQEFVASEVLKSSGPLEQQIEVEPTAIAMTGISSARKRDVKVLSLEGQEPSFDNVQSGRYLLYRSMYLAYNESNPKAEQVKDFIRFAQSDIGRNVIRSQGTVPYIEAMNLMGRKLHESRKARSDDGL